MGGTGAAQRAFRFGVADRHGQKVTQRRSTQQPLKHPAFGRLVRRAAVDQMHWNMGVCAGFQQVRVQLSVKPDANCRLPRLDKFHAALGVVAR